MADIEQATIDRMVRFVRWYADRKLGVFDQESETEARAIVALLPKPVDPLLLKAREIAAEVFKNEGLPNTGERIAAGLSDDNIAVEVALKALQSCNPA